MSPAPCPSCGAPAEPAPAFAPIRLLRCPRCGLVFVPDLVPAEVRDRYTGDDYAHERPEYREDSRLFAYIAAMRVDWVERHARDGRLLEIGCAQGLFLQGALEHGFEVTGVEAAPLHVAHARKRGLPVEQGFLEDMDFAPGSFDLACLFHVLEHVVGPVALLEEVRRVLVPGGLVFIEVPNVASAMARKKGAKWPFLEPENHPLHFSPSSLRRALELAELEVLSVDTTSPRYYLPLRKRLHPRPLLGYAYRSLRVGTFRSVHPVGHDLLRAVARRPPDSARA